MHDKLEYYSSLTEYNNSSTCPRYISIDKLAQHLDFTWLDHIEVVDDPAKTEHIRQFVQGEQINNIGSLHLAIVNLPQVGHAAFTQTSIARGTQFIYPGQILSSDVLGIDPYFFKVADNFAISASTAGNFTRLINDLPSIEELETYYCIHPSTEVASNNLDIMHAKVPGIDLHIIIIVANRDITAHELLGFSYGRDYWRGFSYQSRQLFQPNGQMLAKSHYHIQQYDIIFKLPFSTDPIRVIPLKRDELINTIRQQQSLKFSFWSEKENTPINIEITQDNLQQLLTSQSPFYIDELDFKTYLRLTDNNPLELAHTRIEKAKQALSGSHANPAWALVHLSYAFELLKAYRLFSHPAKPACAPLMATLAPLMHEAKTRLSLTDKRVSLYQAIYPALKL